MQSLNVGIFCILSLLEKRVSKETTMEINWTEQFQPIFEKYGKRQHPLDYKSRYQLVVMVVLSAQDSDKHINELAPTFFAAYPDLKTLDNSRTGGFA